MNPLIVPGLIMSLLTGTALAQTPVGLSAPTAACEAKPASPMPLLKDALGVAAERGEPVPAPGGSDGPRISGWNAAMRHSTSPTAKTTP